MAKNNQNKKPRVVVEPKTPEEESAKKITEEGEVAVPKTLLQEILAKQDQQDEIIAKLKKDNERLTHAADKSRLAQWDQEHAEGLVRRAKISKWDGRLVLAWKMVKDEVGKVDGVLREIQIVKLYLKDTENEEGFVTKEVNYLDFARNTQKEEGEIIEQSKAGKNEYFTIRLKDGQEEKLDIKFIN